MIDVLAALAAGFGVMVVVLLAGIFVTQGESGQNPSPEMIALVIGVALLAGIGTIWVML